MTEVKYKRFNPKIRIQKATQADGTVKYWPEFQTRFLFFKCWNEIGACELDDLKGYCFTSTSVGFFSMSFSEPIDALRFADAFIDHVNMRRREKAARKIVKQEVL